jgi:phospholipase C
VVVIRSFALALVFALCVAAAPQRAPAVSLWSQVLSGPPAVRPVQQLQHLIFIVQENRSFDHYFGTFPGADGIPSPAPCLPDMWHPGRCDRPYHSDIDSNQGNAHGNKWQTLSIDGGKMDGFVDAREQFLGPGCQAGEGTRSVRGSYVDDEGIVRDGRCIVDVMGYHDGTDIPNYWAYASNYVLMDHFFESVVSWSQPNHLGIFSGWSAKCTQEDPPDLSSCASSYGGIPWSSAHPMPDL